MSNASLKEQLQAVASQLSDTLGKEQKPQKKFRQVEKAKHPQQGDKPPQKQADRQHHAANRSQQADKAKKPKPKWLEYVQYGVELLKAYFPACFKSINEVKPLKIGIKQDLVKRLSTIETIVTEDKACMVKSLAYYVNTAVYHKSVIEGATRIDLDGNPAGLVSAEEAKYSTDRHQAKLQAKQTASVNLQSQSKEEEKQ